MSRKIIILFFILVTLCTVVYADDIDLKIADAEKNIRNAASVYVDYKPGMVINSEILDIPVQTAIKKKKEYASSEEAKYKDLKTDVVINLRGAPKNVNIVLDTGISDYSAFTDNIIINANGMYCFVSPSNFSVKKSEANSISINIKDEKNIIAKYNGTAQVNFFKMLLLCLFVCIAVYILLFIFLYVRKTQFKENFNVKKIYCISGIIAVLSLATGIAVFVIDGSSFAEKKNINISEDNTPIFAVDLDSSRNNIQGISIGIPPYNSNFNINLLTACRKSDDLLESDKIIGGKYIESMGIFKFPVNISGNYYIKNNNVTFSDVSSSSEGLYEAISILASKNILSGKADGVYGVDDTVTRAESVTMFCKMLNIDEKSDSDSKFDDINSSDWFYDYVMAGKKYQILSGYNDNTFRANNVITRQEFASVLGQIMQNRYGYILPDDTSNLSVYEDKDDISFWAVNYVSLLERENVNIWQKNYIPRQPITRGEAAMMLYRAYSLAE